MEKMDTWDTTYLTEHPIELAKHTTPDLCLSSSPGCPLSEAKRAIMPVGQEVVSQQGVMDERLEDDGEEARLANISEPSQA